MCLEAIHYFEGINVTFLEIIHQFIILALKNEESTRTFQELTTLY